MSWRTVTGGVLVAGLVAGCSSQRGEDSNDFEQAKEAVSHNLRDPAAAQFRDLGRCPNDRDMVSGQFNGKNAFGAYVGFESFYYVDGVVTKLADPDFMTAMEQCYGKGAGETDSVEDLAAEAAKNAK